MPWGLRRFHESGQSHFVTFCCYRRQKLLDSIHAKRTFETALERIRRDYRLRVYGYVVMPEHVHVLISEPERETVAIAIKSLKQGVSRRLTRDRGQHMWQKRYYDMNVRNYRQFVEKLRYIHRNPVKCGLCMEPAAWEWSSFRQYAFGQAGRVEVECEWVARQRERMAGKLAPPVELPHSSRA